MAAAVFSYHDQVGVVLALPMVLNHGHQGVYVRLTPSKLHGVGVFAICEIPPGTMGRMTRRLPCGRKNYLFAGSDDGGRPPLRSTR